MKSVATLAKNICLLALLDSRACKKSKKTLNFCPIYRRATKKIATFVGELVVL